MNLENIILHLLASEAKKIEAPASSIAHFDFALVELMKLCPGFKTENREYLEVIDAAQSHMSYYSGKTLEKIQKDI